LLNDHGALHLIASALDIFQSHYQVMTLKNGADFVRFVMQAQAPASQNGQSRV